jgi:hypothetical protein
MALGAFVFAATAWRFFGYPTSVDEAIFLYKLSSRVSAGSSGLKLEELMPGDWELVCTSHSYDGPQYLKRYNKTYPPAAPSEDGVWGFIFIAKDGSYRSAVGSCGSAGVHLDFRSRFCLTRNEANLSLSPRGLEPCVTFSPQMANPSINTDAAR